MAGKAIRKRIMPTIKYPYVETYKSAVYAYDIIGERPGEWSIVQIVSRGPRKEATWVRSYKTRAEARRAFDAALCPHCMRSDFD